MSLALALLACAVSFVAGWVGGVHATARVAHTLDPEHYPEPVYHPHHGGPHMSEPTPSRRGRIIALVVLVASLVVVGIGIQAKLASDDNAERDRRDGQYADCLTDFARDLVDTIQANRDATVKLDQAQARTDEAQTLRDNAVDQIILAVVGARSTPPTVTEEDFQTTLERFPKVKAALVRAQAEEARVAKETAKTRAENPYARPEASCSR